MAKSKKGSGSFVKYRKAGKPGFPFTTYHKRGGSGSGRKKYLFHAHVSKPLGCCLSPKKVGPGSLLGGINHLYRRVRASGDDFKHGL
jgi:hypothetical protein